MTVYANNSIQNNGGKLCQQILIIMLFYMTFMVIYPILFILDSDLEKKLHFINLTNPKNPNLTLNYTDYADSCL